MVEIQSVHFTGIGGTAMASAAAAMQDKGYTVTGSDQNVYEPMASFLAGKQISKLSQSEGASVIEGPFDQKYITTVFESLDLVDIMAVRAGSEVWRQSFRRPQL